MRIAQPHRDRTVRLLGPGVKPTATRAGIPSVRAIAAIVKEKWTQKPCLSFRNRLIAALPVPEFTEVS